MKKLMIAAAIVCAAALSQAATVQWKVTNIKDDAGTTKVGTGTYYVMCFAADSAGNKLGKDISIADASALAAAGKISDLSAKANFAGTNTGLGVYASRTSSDVFAGNDVVKLFAIVFNDDVPGDATKYQIVSDPASYTFADAAESKQLTVNMSSGTWNNISAVPEPTSGLLLLLGVAGLALRRRRA